MACILHESLLLTRCSLSLSLSLSLRIILAAFEVLNSVPLISWFPFYYELKVVFLLLLQIPSVNLARVIFDTWLEPFLAGSSPSMSRRLSRLTLLLPIFRPPFPPEHEELIDHTLDEHMSKAAALGGNLVKSGVSYARQRVSGIVAAEVATQVAGTPPSNSNKKQS